MTTNFKFDEDLFHRGKGTINASGALNTLNGTSFNDTEILLREAIQNSFDAREVQIVIDNKTQQKVKKHKILDFKIRAFHFTTENVLFINNSFRNENRNNYFCKNIAPFLSEEKINIELTDLNTIGLIGVPGLTDKKQHQNFANFVYYTGDSKEEGSVSGGSYGFGKAAYYLYSDVRTIIVYSRIKKDTDYQSRLIAISMDERIDIGRCWWGIKKKSDFGDESFAAPVIGPEADVVANGIGFIPFNQEQSGTKILILNAKPRGVATHENGNPKSIDDIIKYDIPAYLVHWYWNKIIANKIVFSVEYDGKQIEIDNPLEVYPYDCFFKAYKRLLSIKKGEIKSDSKRGIKIDFERPKVSLGIASIEKTIPKKAKYADLIATLDTSQPLVVFMRGIGNIVYYNKYSLGSDNIGKTCYGVFACDTKSHTDAEMPGEIDRYFRGIENQTHTKWEHNSDKYHWNYLKRVETAVEALVRNNCIIEDVDDPAANISIMVQRTLGKKLLPYRHSIGGAKKELQENRVGIIHANDKKSSIEKTGKILIDIDKETGLKIVSIQCKINVLKNKKIVIKSIIPIIFTPDGSFRDEDNSYVSIVGSIIVDKNNQYPFPFFPMVHSSPGVWFIKLECKKNCVFDLKFDYEEQND